MAWKVINEADAKKYLCVAADAKPTTNVPLGSKALETDTDKVFIFNGSTWSEITGLYF